MMMPPSSTNIAPTCSAGTASDNNNPQTCPVPTTNSNHAHVMTPTQMPMMTTITTNWFNRHINKIDILAHNIRGFSQIITPAMPTEPTIVPLLASSTQNPDFYSTLPDDAPTGDDPHPIIPLVTPPIAPPHQQPHLAYEPTMHLDLSGIPHADVNMAASKPASKAPNPHSTPGPLITLRHKPHPSHSFMKALFLLTDHKY